MRFLLIILLVFSFSVFLAPQTSAQDENGEKGKMSKNKVQMQTKWKYRPNATKGVMIVSKSFDSKGNTVQELNYKPDGTKSSRLTYKYDFSNNKIYYELYDFSKPASQRIQYNQEISYNGQGDRVSESGFDGVSGFKIQYEYVSAGKLSNVIKKDNSGFVTEKKKYTYSGSDVILSVVDINGKVKEKTIEKFNTSKQLIEKSKVSSDGVVFQHAKYEYNINEQIEKEEVEYNGEFSYRLKYYYNLNNNLLKIEKETSDGKRFVNNSYTYDSKGNLIEEKWYDGLPDDYSKKSYNYDDKDNIKEIDSYYSVYKYKVLYKYTYKYY